MYNIRQRKKDGKDGERKKVGNAFIVYFKRAGKVVQPAAAALAAGFISRIPADKHPSLDFIAFGF